MNENNQVLGMVENGQFRRLWPRPTPIGITRLTTIPMQAAVPPESGEIPLKEYEGKAIMVAGMDQGGWIYVARVIDEAGPILTAVVVKLFAEG